MPRWILSPKLGFREAAHILSHRRQMSNRGICGVSTLCGNHLPPASATSRGRYFFRLTKRRIRNRFSAEGGQLRSDIHGENDRNKRTQNYGEGLLGGIKRKQTGGDHQNSSGDKQNEKRNGDLRPPSFHGHHQDSRHGVKRAEASACISGGRAIGNCDAEESVSNAGRHLRHAKNNHQKSNDDDSSRVGLAHRLILSRRLNPPQFLLWLWRNHSLKPLLSAAAPESSRSLLFDCAPPAD